VEAEERGLDSAVVVLTSTQQEVDEQWGLYDGWAGGGLCLGVARCWSSALRCH
jgi:hypothetical protein